MIARITLAVIVTAIVNVPVVAQPHSDAPTYTRNVAPILFKSCTGCHRPQGMAPMSLMTYQDVMAAAADIGDAVSTGYMPPWHSDSPHGQFANDRRLSDSEKKTIDSWLKAGAPEGSPKDLPPAPVYTTEWSIGTPDVVLEMPKAYDVPAKGTIEYQYVEIPTNFTEDKWVKAIEILPGAREVVHHVIVYARPPAPPPGTPRQPSILAYREDHLQPQAPPDPNKPRRRLGPMIAAIAPGTDAQVFPEGTALRVAAGSVLTLQLHYTAHGHAMSDKSRVGFVFAKEEPAEEMVATAFTNDVFVLPAGSSNIAVPSEIGFKESAKIYAMVPHTHLRGKKWDYRLVYPDGKVESILSLPNYDFNWQTYYKFAKPLVIPPGAKIEATAWYDNSANNPSNPDPKVDVRWGDQTWEEMQFTAFWYTIDSRRRAPATK